MIIFIVWAVILCGFILGIWRYAVKPIINAFKAGYSDRWEEIHAPPENDDTSDLNRLERIENYDRQIDGCTQLIKTLDICLQNETDLKKKAVLLSKQLVTLEKLNKIIEKREKLE